MFFFTADTHLGHTNILSQCRPQFGSVDQMDDAIIQSINKRMTRADTLYILGDFIFRSVQAPQAYLERLKPKKLLIEGNHDRDWLRKLTDEEKSRYFLDITPQYTIKKNGIELHLCHFPQLAWKRSHFFGTSFSICGHIHNGRDSLAAQLFPQITNQFNAGVDINGFAPVTFGELVENNAAFYGRTYTSEEQEKLTAAISKL